MIKLYDINETKFLNNGLCNMIPLKCLETKKKSLNGWFVEIELPVKYEQYLLKDRIVLVNTKEKGSQPFRIGNITKKDRKISFTANHIVFDAERYLLDDVRPTDLAPVSYLKWINERTDNHSPFEVTSNLNGSATTYFIRKTLLDGFQKAEEIFGGCYDIDMFKISLLSRVGKDEGFSIIYGKNLQGISIVEDWTNVCTKILPVGPDELLLPETYISGDVQYDIPYTKTVTFDFETSYEDDEGNNIDYPLEYKINMLRNLANDYLKTNSVPLISYVVNSDVDQNLRIGDNIHVKHPFVNITTEVQEYTYNCLSKKVKSITFGNYERDVKKVFNNFKDSIKEANNTAINALNEVIKQTDIINRLNKEGYVYIDENEILILDTLPKENAKQVWRFGLGGIGFSSTGYKGPFIYALTQDGHFNTDFIKANSITVNHLAADVGSKLDLSSNESIKLIVQEIAETKIEDSIPYHIIIESSNGFQLSEDIESTVLNARVYKGNLEIDVEGEYSYTWYYRYSTTEEYTVLGNGKSITVIASILDNTKVIVKVDDSNQILQLIDDLGYVLIDELGNTIGG